MLLLDHWYAIQVRPRYERVVSRLLLEKGYEYLLPMYKTGSRYARRTLPELPLFPNYVFCKITPSALLPIVTTMGVVRIVGAGREPIPLNNEDVDVLQRIVNGRLEAEPYTYLQCGKKVRIETGPLAGLDGLLLRFRNAHRLILSIELLRRSIAIEIDSTCVVPA